MNQYYDNEFISNEVEDALNSHLDLTRFCTVNNDLVGVAGDRIKFNVYSATNGTQILDLGEGNTQSIQTRLSSEEYRILLAQNRFDYYDEEQMRDPNVVPVGIDKAAKDLYNTEQGMIYSEFLKAPQTEVSAFDFNAFADAVSVLDIPENEEVDIFALVHPKDVATLRKSLKDTLQYVEAFARTGYIGSVAGINVYTKKDAVQGVVVIAMKDAVTLFNKRGTETEQERDANTRMNSIFNRKYFVPVLTDASKAVTLNNGAVSALKALTIGDVLLGFQPGVTKYKVTTPNATDTITATAYDEGATPVIKNGATAVTSGTAATWVNGHNTVTVTVTNGSASTVYTIDVLCEHAGE